MEQHGERNWTALVIMLVTLACVCSAIGIAGVWIAAQEMQRPGFAPQIGAHTPSSAAGWIAYVGQDGNLYTITPDGQERQAITHDQSADTGSYNMLAWSPDGQLAFMTSTDKESALYTVQPGGQPIRVYAGNASAAPFYLYWSPDGQHVAFLTPSQRGRTALWMANSHNDDATETIALGSPSYFSWSPDSQSLLMHIGGVSSVSSDARVAIFQTQPGDTLELPDPPGAFQAPAWSPDGTRFLFVRETDQGDDLILVEGNDRRVLASSRTGLVFNWSPQGNRIAFARPSSHDEFLYDGVVVLDLDSQEQRMVAGGSVAAFFWSPDGRQLAMLSIDEANRRPQGQSPGAARRGQAMPASQIAQVRLMWSVLHIADDTSVDFPSFRPTDPFLLLVPYFDQYAQSLSLWSPDSRYLVFADLDEREQPSVRVLDTTQPKQPAQRLAEGTFAVWSWR